MGSVKLNDVAHRAMKLRATELGMKLSEALRRASNLWLETNPDPRDLLNKKMNRPT